MIDLQKVVIPANAGIWPAHNLLKILDSGFRRNDKIKHSSTFCEIITAEMSEKTSDIAGESFRIQVECYAGYRGEETPRRFFLQGRKREITDILDRWLAPDHRYFKVKCDNRDTYVLRHDTITNKWELIMFEKGP